MKVGLRELKEKVRLPPINQICIVVKDAYREIQHYSNIFRLEPGTMYELTPEKHWVREKPTSTKFLMVKTMLGEIEICFMQPLE
jgi:hypothetical protein